MGSESGFKEHYDNVRQVLQHSAIDQILFRLAENAMRAGGHRYGAFLDAATTAAKLIIYLTYLEEQQNLRKTGHLHHLESKRVKAIVKEIQASLESNYLLKILGSQEPRYLIGLPYLWQQYYPWQTNSSRFTTTSLTTTEKDLLMAQLPENVPDVRIITTIEFNDLIALLHQRSQEDLPVKQRSDLSDALTDHLKMRLLYSGTVIRLDHPGGLPFYMLARKTYSPAGIQARTCTMLEDVASIFDILQAWVNEESGILRAVETFDINPEQRDEAAQELSDLLQTWADKYHQDGGYPMLLHVALGERKESNIYSDL